jgi:hypothetical protein
MLVVGEDGAYLEVTPMTQSRQDRKPFKVPVTIESDAPDISPVLNYLMLKSSVRQNVIDFAWAVGVERLAKHIDERGNIDRGAILDLFTDWQNQQRG